MKPWQENQLQLLHPIQTNQQLFQQILALSKEVGFEYYAYGIRTPVPLSNPKTFIFSNYPEDWQTQYQSKNYIAIDPSVQVATKSLLPIVWSDDLFNTVPNLWEEARAYGLHFGVAQSIRDFNGITSMLTLARSNESITEVELNTKRFEITWLTQIAHIRMSKYWVPKVIPEVNAKLSTREKEVLRWTADGKTSCEISCILKIAECTVNFHINNALVKLNASNKVAATIKAAMLGLI